MYAPIGIMHITNGRILDGVTFDTSTVKYQGECLNPFAWHLEVQNWSLGPLRIKLWKRVTCGCFIALMLQKLRPFFLFTSVPGQWGHFYIAIHCVSCVLQSEVVTIKNCKNILRPNTFFYSTTMSDWYLVHCQRYFLQRGY